MVYSIKDILLLRHSHTVNEHSINKMWACLSGTGAERSDGHDTKDGFTMLYNSKKENHEHCKSECHRLSTSPFAKQASRSMRIAASIPPFHPQFPNSTGNNLHNIIHLFTPNGLLNVPPGTRVYCVTPGLPIPAGAVILPILYADQLQILQEVPIFQYPFFPCNNNYNYPSTSNQENDDSYTFEESSDSNILIQLPPQ